ncbi:MAG: hypothetical protein D6815_02545 [Candidatus Dadabacteria bacterium]|nr:MAG: hypothetical protein D6815_02545 [Candidatus Dadabacteria bacterium]
MAKRCVVLIVAVAALACSQSLYKKNDEAPAYVTQVVPGGIRYLHNWAERPCFSLALGGSDWQLDQSTGDDVRWHRGNLVFHLYLTDNRKAAFAVSGMSPEQALRAFIGYELDYVRPMFEFLVNRPPKFAEDQNGVWVEWGWEGHGGKRTGARVEAPADQRHIIYSLWIDPWVLSLDWATTDLSTPPGATPEMIDVIESLRFHPQCFAPMKVGETWNAKGKAKGAPPPGKPWRR